MLSVSPPKLEFQFANCMSCTCKLYSHLLYYYFDFFLKIHFYCVFSSSQWFPREPLHLQSHSDRGRSAVLHRSHPQLLRFTSGTSTHMHWHPCRSEYPAERGLVLELEKETRKCDLYIMSTFKKISYLEEIKYTGTIWASCCFGIYMKSHFVLQLRPNANSEHLFALKG